jgi:hypothetical protein
VSGKGEEKLQSTHTYIYIIRVYLHTGAQPASSGFNPEFLNPKPHPETYQQSSFLVLLDAFSSRFFKTNVLFLHTFFSSAYICFLFPLASVSFV